MSLSNTSWLLICWDFVGYPLCQDGEGIRSVVAVGYAVSHTCVLCDTTPVCCVITHLYAV